MNLTGHKSDKGLIDGLPYFPERIGSISMQSRTTVLGWCHDYQQTLIAISIQGAATSVEQCHYSLQGQDANISVQMIDQQRDGYSRHAYARKCHFRTRKTPIPDTSDVSLIMLNDSLFAPNKELDYTHVWYRNEEDFKRELFMRVREIVYIPLKEEWSGYLSMYGQSTEYQGKPLCGRLAKRGVTQGSWMCAGFSIGYIRADREQWERMISLGLKKNIIRL